MLEHGAYLLLMAEYYITGNPLPADALQLHYICRAHSAEECQAIASVLSNYFTLEDDGYHQKRIDLELAKSRQLRLKKQKAGNSRWNARAMQVHTQLHIQPHAQKEPKTYIRKFEKPSLDEVSAYCLERQSGVDPQLWYDFYSSKGWMVGSNAMKDWKAAVRTWEKNGRGGNGNGQTRISPTDERAEHNKQSILNAFAARACETDLPYSPKLESKD